MLVPLRESKTQRSIILPDRIWEFVKEQIAVITVDGIYSQTQKVSYTEGVRYFLEEAYARKQK
jgi:hypothetical protein